MARRFSAKITSRLPYLLIELFRIRLPVVRTDGRADGRTAYPRATEEHLRALSGHVLPGDRAFAKSLFLGVAETIVSSLLCCGVGIVQCLFNLLYYVIGVRNTKKPPKSHPTPGIP